MKKSIFIVLATLLLASLACNFSGLSGAAGLPEGVLFQDDFSGRGGGWDSISDFDGTTDYLDGEYRIQVNVDNTDFWSNPNTDKFSDVIIEVDARRVGGPDVNVFGVQCRHEKTGSDDNPIYKFYFFVVGSDGYATIGKVDTSRGEADAYTYFEYSENNVDIKPSETNRIVASCVGNTLTLSVNGSQLLSVQDSSLASGEVGLIAGTFDETGADVRFDNFVVRKP